MPGTEQTIFRSMPASDYTVINNAVFRSGLSLLAIGVCCLIVSKPSDWVVRIEQMEREFKESEGAIKRALKELAEAGFMMRCRERHEDGTVNTITLVADTPRFAEIGTAEQRTQGYGYDEIVTDPPKNRGSVKPRGRLDRGSVDEGVIISNEIPLSNDPQSKGDAPPSAATLAPVAVIEGEKPKSPTHTMLHAYLELVGVELTKDEIGREARKAKWLVEHGYTVEQMRWAYNHFKPEKFWQDKRLTLRYIADQLPTLKQRYEKGLGAPRGPKVTDPGTIRNYVEELLATVTPQGAPA